MGEFLSTSLDNGISHVHIHEESIQTFGTCCWRLYSEQGHRGASQILRGNRDFPSSTYWSSRSRSWSPGQVKSVRKCRSCQDCSRHNKHKRSKRRKKKTHIKKSYLKCFFNAVSCW